jgi:hypothetical protein
MAGAVRIVKFFSRRQKNAFLPKKGFIAEK